MPKANEILGFVSESVVQEKNAPEAGAVYEASDKKRKKNSKVGCTKLWRGFWSS